MSAFKIYSGKREPREETWQYYNIQICLSCMQKLYSISKAIATYKNAEPLPIITVISIMDYTSEQTGKYELQ